MKNIFLIIFFLAVLFSRIEAEEGYAFKNLYEIEVILEGTDRSSINKGMRDALQSLMINLSGVSDINRYSVLKVALKNPEEYVSEYRLTSEEENLLGIFSFNGEEVRELLSNNNLPLWIGIKPRVLLFLPCKSQTFLTVEKEKDFLKRKQLCKETKDKILEKGSMRNIVFIEPVLDFVDLKFIDLFKPKSDQDFLNKFSLRYGLEDWAICYIQDEYGVLVEEPKCITPLSDLRKITLLETVDLLADELTKDFQLNIDSNLTNKLTILITGIEKFDHLISVENIIASNTLVSSYFMSSLSGNTASYQLEIKGKIVDLQMLMSVNPFLVGQPEIIEDESLKYIFKPGK
tara:strand:+ start:637 stop:1674 length:1038 start_codon:yes stop_codon:yes gene_type:complete